MVVVRRVSDGEMTAIDFEDEVLRWICGYAPQGGRKTMFYDELKGEWDMHSAGDLVMCLGDFDGHVGRHIDGFDGIHGGHGVGEKNFEG